jgi:hypothetical protein
MAKKTAKTEKASRIKKILGNIDSSDLLNVIFGASTLKDFAKTEKGKATIDKISSNSLGIGTKDEALFKKACTFLLDKILELGRTTQSKERKEVLKKIEKFLKDLEAAGYSRWWFRNALATMRKGDATGENQAAMTLSEIIEGNDFKEMKTLAGGDLIRKTYKKSISDGWEFVVNKSGKLDLLVDIPKFKKFVPSPKKM